jgi:hypothetical protein
MWVSALPLDQGVWFNADFIHSFIHSFIAIAKFWILANLTKREQSQEHFMVKKFRLTEESLVREVFIRGV